MARLVERHMKPVYAFAYRMTGNHADADDMVQQTFLRSIEKIGRFRPGTDFRAWVLTIASRLCTDLYRRKRVRREVSLGESPAGRPDGRAPDPLDALAEAEDGRALRAALDALPVEQRAVVLLHGMEGVPMALIARGTDTPEGTIRWRYHQARERLAALLAGKGLFGIPAVS